MERAGARLRPGRSRTRFSGGCKAGEGKQQGGRCVAVINAEDLSSAATFAAAVTDVSPIVFGIESIYGREGSDTDEGQGAKRTQEMGVLFVQ